MHRQCNHAAAASAAKSALRTVLKGGIAAASAVHILVFSAALPASFGYRAFATDLNEGVSVSLKDVPPPAVAYSPILQGFYPIWQGFYLGGHAGVASEDPSVSDPFTYVGDPTLNSSFSSTGFIGGGQIGYNIQNGHFVFGVEGDIGYLGLSSHKSTSSDPNSCSRAGDPYIYPAEYCFLDARYSSSTGLYGDLTGRLGYSLDRILFYAKGGVAFLDADFKANYAGGNCTFDYGCGGNTNVPSTFNFGHSETLVGWTAGGGVEYALNPSWSMKLEYQHFDFGSMAYNYSGTYYIPNTPNYKSTLSGRMDASYTADAVTLGVNFHFNSAAGLK